MLEMDLKVRLEQVLKQVLKQFAQAGAQALLEGDRIEDCRYRAILNRDPDAAGLVKRPSDALPNRQAVHGGPGETNTGQTLATERSLRPSRAGHPHPALVPPIRIAVLRAAGANRSALLGPQRLDAPRGGGAVQSLARQKARPHCSQIFTGAYFGRGGYAWAVLERCLRCCSAVASRAEVSTGGSIRLDRPVHPAVSVAGCAV